MPIIRKGFTLLEVIISMAILCIGLLLLLQIQIKSINNTNEAKYRTTAINQAQNLAEYLRSHLTIQIDRHMQEWNELNAKLLPGGEGTIEKNPDGYRIKVSWLGKERHNNNRHHIEIFVAKNN